MVTNEGHSVLQNSLGCSKMDQGASMVTDESHFMLQNIPGHLSDDTEVLSGAPEQLGVPQWGPMRGIRCSRTAWGASVVINETHLMIQNSLGCSRMAQGASMVTDETHFVLQNIPGHLSDNTEVLCSAPEQLGVPQW